ncbi:MAG: hypothetical protein AVDCRST_MAG68-742 [uncultured Gemmatimonadetes bacterium]|uniref:Uncharacterized protein n=1 Tax=uncultured Gemmatimonadota bacterium TaxID=203437 RepID=A0A6J4KFU9_9BACT|nr:MAG: hypothetical protein AVDCRST_MAG68-742 [uncultured Gemmatimonadota bacterium]
MCRRRRRNGAQRTCDFEGGGWRSPLAPAGALTPRPPLPITGEGAISTRGPDEAAPANPRPS